MATATDSRAAGETGREKGKRARILAAAQDVFTEQGFDAARMEEVARRARVGKGTLYNYYESKEDLLIHAVIQSMEEVRERIEAAVDPSPDEPIRSVEHVLRMLIVDALPGLTRRPHSLEEQARGLIARDSEAGRRLLEASRSFYRERERAFEGLIQAGAGAGRFRSDVDPADMSLLLLAVFDGLRHRAAFDEPRVDPSRAFGAVLQLLRGGLYRAPAEGAERTR